VQTPTEQAFTSDGEMGGAPLPVSAQQTAQQSTRDTSYTIDLGVKLGDTITTKLGVKGRVRTIAIDKVTSGVWIEGIDSTGRPFEDWVNEKEIVPCPAASSDPA
jgi:hypothetical protein